MNKNFTKIVLTGGPCGGKSTGLSYIEREMSKRGYKVVFVNETATELVLNGISLSAYNNDYYQFEKQIVKLQILKEKMYEECCETLPDEKILLVCDRGFMDCRSYVTEEDFDRILKELGEDFIHLRDNYDGVFHLMTCAKGAEEYYNTSNNNARRESLEEAREADDRVIQCWTGHPHFRVIDNSTNFEGKMGKLINEICSLLGEPTPFEIERKYLIEKPDLQKLESLANCKKVNIIQTYLISEDGIETRVRQRGLAGSYIYTLTTKRNISPMTRVEFEQRISERQYLTYLANADTNLKSIRKDRYCLMQNGKYFEIDVYPFAKQRAILEIELTSEDENIKLPEFIKVVREVTDDKTYSNYAFKKSSRRYVLIKGKKNEDIST